MAEYSKIIEGTFTSTGVAKALLFPMVPQQIEIRNKTKWNTTTDNTAFQAYGMSEDTNGTAYALQSNSTAVENVTLTTGGFTFFDAGTYQYGPTFTISGINQTTGVVTTTAPHGYVVGDTVLLTGTTGMLQVAGWLFTVTAVGSNVTFTVNIGGLVAAAATAGSVKKLLYADLYIPFNCPVVSVTQANPCVVTTSVNHSFVVGQEVFFVIPPQYGMTQLDSLTYATANGTPQRAYVTAVGARTITLNLNSTAFTAFALPTSAVAALGVSQAQVMAIGDANTGYTGPTVPTPQTIPGAFAANTRRGVIVGTGDGTTILHATSDVVWFRAEFPDAFNLNA